jgi:hypothetical protein
MLHFCLTNDSNVMRYDSNFHIPDHTYRFRGTVYPSVCLPASVETDLKVTAVLAENQFQQMSPAAKFGPIIVARSIV